MARLLREADPRARVRRGVEGVLGQAVESGLRGSDNHSSVRRSLGSLCRVARRQGLHVEHLIVIFKDAWRTLPQRHGLSPEAGAEVLKGVVSLCIDEFYRTDRAALGTTTTSESAQVTDASLSFMLGPLS